MQFVEGQTVGIDLGTTYSTLAYVDAEGEEIEWPVLLDPYLRNVRIHLCPADRHSQWTSYGLNELGFVDLTDRGSGAPKRLSGFRSGCISERRSDCPTLPAGPND